MLWKCCTQHVSKSRKLSSGHRIEKGQFSSQSQKEAMPKNAQTTIQLYSHARKVMLKILQARLQQNMNWELPDVQTGFRKDLNERSNCQRMKSGEEGDYRRWDGWMASLTQWTWVWASSRKWCCSPWRHKQLETTEQLNTTTNNRSNAPNIVILSEWIY